METGSLEAARQVRTLFNVGAAGGLTDGQLLDRFATRDGEGAEFAFAVLVERHGPMVLRACRRTLADPNDARDAFQATFVVLVRRASSLRVHDSLAPWLREVATRVATRARSDATRRRARERAAAERSPRAVADPDRSAVEIGAIVREEVEQLPGRNRAAVVLCGLEGLTLEQAARQLGWPVGTVQSRLSRGRARLRDRLIRRGLAPALALTALAPPAEALPAALIHATTRLAMRAAIQGSTGAIPAAVAALSQGVMRMMLVNQIKLAGLAVVASGLTFAGAVGLAQDPAALPAPSPARAERPVPTPSMPRSRGIKAVGKLPSLTDVLMQAPWLQDLATKDLRIEVYAKEDEAAPGEASRPTGDHICKVSYLVEGPDGIERTRDINFMIPAGFRRDPSERRAPLIPSPAPAVENGASPFDKPQPARSDQRGMEMMDMMRNSSMMDIMRGNRPPPADTPQPARSGQMQMDPMMGMMMGNRPPPADTPQPARSGQDPLTMMMGRMSKTPATDPEPRNEGNQRRETTVPKASEGVSRQVTPSPVAAPEIKPTETTAEPIAGSQARRLDDLEGKIDRILKLLGADKVPDPLAPPPRNSSMEPGLRF